MGDFEIALPPGYGGSDPAHTHAHEATTGKGTDDHHAKSHAHSGADGSGTVAHSATTGKTANDHHNQAHTDSDHSDGANVKKALVTTKGDLVTATASATPDRLAAGANGLVLVTDSAQSTGLKYATGVRRWAVPYHGGIGNTSQVGVTGRVFLAMVEIPFGATANAIAYVVGATSSGNVTVGIYGPVTQTADTCAGAALVVQSSSTGQGTANTNQVVSLSTTPLTAGLYYIAFEMDNTTGTYYRLANLTTPQGPGLAQYYDRGGGYGTLTDPCPAVTESANNVPGLRIRCA